MPGLDTFKESIEKSWKFADDAVDWSLDKLGISALGKFLIKIGQKITFGIFLGRISSRLWVVALKISLLYYVSVWLMGWVLYWVQPVISGALSLVPSVFGPVMGRFWQFVEATSGVLPWDDLGLVVKWLVLIKLFILTWHLTEFVISRTMKFLTFLTGGE